MPEYDHNEKFILNLSDAEKLRLISSILARYDSNINNKKPSEISELHSTIRWIATSGKYGINYGHGWVYRVMEW